MWFFNYFFTFEYYQSLIKNEKTTSYFFSLILINYKKDDLGEDPIKVRWLGEFESEDYNGDKVYFQVMYYFDDRNLLLTKSKF